MLGSFATLDSLFDEFRRVEQELDQLFGPNPWPMEIRSLPRGAFPAANIGATPEQLTLYAFAPGVDPKSLDIAMQQNLLTVSGERKIAEEEQATYYRQERFNGEFRRVFTLPEDVDPDRVNATYRDGVLQITVHRKEAARPRQIEVQ